MAEVREWHDGGQTQRERVHWPPYAAVIGEYLEVGTVLQDEKEIVWGAFVESGRFDV
jgi:hypothetical protein